MSRMSPNLPDEEAQAPVSCEHNRPIRDDFRCSRATKGLQSSHYEIRKDALITPNWDNGVAEPDAAFHQHVDDHRLR